MNRVLILDDDELFSRTLADRLMRETELQLTTVPTTSAEEARQAVLHATEPFDIFLIDQRLGPGPDGIEVMQELRCLNPEAEAIIFTGVGDRESGLHAYQAGAYRYLPKPFSTSELLWILRSLLEWRRAQHERDWLRVLTEVAEEAQRALSVREVAEIIVRGGQQLGFERARLWLPDSTCRTLKGLSQVGNKGLEDFAEFRMPVAKSPYSQRALSSQDPVFFKGRELGPGYLDLHFAEKGFEPPVGEWVYMALWTGKRCQGVLALDNACHPEPLRANRRRLLKLFGRQAAAALERARLFQREARKSKEMEVLNQIGRHVTARAALDDLDTLLSEVRTQVGKLMDGRNFMVVLWDEETGLLDFRLHVENDRLQRRVWRTPQKAGLIGHVVQTNQPLLLPRGDREYREAHNIPLFGRQSRCWMGVPLRVGAKVVGAIAVQSYESEEAYGKDDLRLLTAVADQVAGAIETAHLKEREAETSRKLAMLHRVSEEFMQLAEGSEDWLWHATLTAATADYALGFNRAVLFLAEEGGTRLRGRMGIGHFESFRARLAWGRDRRAGLDFDGYLQRLRTDNLKPTPVEKAVRKWVLDLSEGGGAFQEVLRKGQRVIVHAEDVEARLPGDFVKRFGRAEYAVVPLRAGSKILGLVVVDNVHDQKPLRAITLDHLETLLTQAVLTFESLRQRRARDQLIDLNYTIMAEVSNRPLKETLTRICSAAQEATGADYVAVYPLKPGVEPYEFEVDDVGYVGNESDLHLRSEVRQKGVTSHILRSGTLTVSDVRQHPQQYGGQRLEEHPFLQRERVRAFIGVPVRDVQTGEPLGVLYLDFRTPYEFTQQDVRQAESFASLAAVAIRNARTAQRIREGLAVAESATLAREKELTILRGVLEEALAAESNNRRRVVRTLLHAARDLLDQPGAHVDLLLREWQRPEHPGQEPAEIWRWYILDPNGALSITLKPEVDENDEGLQQSRGTRVMSRMSHARWVRPFQKKDKVQSEQNIPIKLGKQVIGSFHVRLPHGVKLTATQRAILERLAAAAALALDNVRRQHHLHTVLAAARVVTAPTDLEKTLQAIVTAVQKVAPELSALTIWYREPGSDQIVLGPHFGVRSVASMQQTEPRPGSVVWKVMQNSGPIWAPVAKDEPRLAGRFIEEEGIESAAALRLRADNEVVGVMFFNYRQPHEFTSEEKALFPILAEIAAASVRDAARLEAMRKERQRQEAALAIAEAAGTTVSLDQTLRKIMESLRQLFPGTVPSVLTYNEAEHVLEFTPASQAFYRIDNLDEAGRTRVDVEGLSIASYVARTALASKQVELVNEGDVSRNPHYLRLISNTRSELCISLMSGERLLGVLVLESPEPDAFDEDDVNVVRSVAHQVSVAIDRVQKSRQLRFKNIVASATAWAMEIAHSIRREVGIIRDRAYWLDQEPGLSDEGHQYAFEIDQSAERLAGALADASPRPAEAPEPVELDPRLREWVKEFVSTREEEITTEFELRCAGVRVAMPAAALRRVVRHFVRNALEAISGSGTVTVRSRTVSDQWIEVQIEDDGPGIPLHLRQALFQERVSTKGEERGFGLLFARSIVEDFGGTVRLLPFQPGRGAAFAFTLPVAVQTPEGRLPGVSRNEQAPKVVSMYMPSSDHRE